MSDVNLSQDEANMLIGMEKHSVSDEEYEYPSLGGRISVPLLSSDKRENFTLDISRGRIDLTKGTYQNRARQTVILVRLDFGGPAHRNPDGEEVPSPHIHIFREGFGDKWAVAVPLERFRNMSDLWTTMEDFMVFCNITRRPNISKGLFK